MSLPLDLRHIKTAPGVEVPCCHGPRRVEGAASPSACLHITWIRLLMAQALACHGYSSVATGLRKRRAVGGGMDRAARQSEYWSGYLPLFQLITQPTAGHGARTNRTADPQTASQTLSAAEKATRAEAWQQFSM